MIWLVPAASLGLVALIVPWLIHLFARRPAPRRPFPTLRFLRASTSQSRSFRPTDPLLLIVRASIIGTAVAALAGPLFLTQARQDSWNARVARATVTEDGGGAADAPGEAAFARTIHATDLRLGIAQAAAWLSSVPPARREIVVRAAFASGSLEAETLAALDPGIGLRFERTETSSPGDLMGTPILSLVNGRSDIITPRVTVTERGSVLRHDATGMTTPPCEPRVSVSAPEGSRVEAEAALRAVIVRGVPCSSSPDRRIHLRFASGSPGPPATSPLRGWMPSVLATLARTIGTRAVETATADADGRTLTIVVAGRAATPDGLAAIRAAFTALAETPASGRHEGSRLDDATLAAWSRPAGPAPPDAIRFARESDGRWIWGVVLALLIVEHALRRRAHPATADLRSAA